MKAILLILLSLAFISISSIGLADTAPDVIAKCKQEHIACMKDCNKDCVNDTTCFESCKQSCMLDLLACDRSMLNKQQDVPSQDTGTTP